jgi:hypothetical protein
MNTVSTLPILTVLNPLPIAAWSVDSFTTLGIVITALLGVCGFIYQVSNNRRASYVGIISDARLEWIGTLRSEVATLLALGHLWIHTRPADAEAKKLWAKIIASVYKTRLLLTPAARSHSSNTASVNYIDNQIDQQIASFLETLTSEDAAPADQASAELLASTQNLIWNEWLKTKIESIDGDPYDTVYHAWSRKFQKYRAWIDKFYN